MLRTRKAVGLQLAVVALLAMLIVALWPNDAWVAQSKSAHVLRVFGYGLLAAIILLVPIFPATSIVRERERGTLALLLNSSLKPSEILFGKAVGSLGFIGIVLLLSLPAAAATYPMSGVRLEQILQVFVLILLVAIQYGAIALYISSRVLSVDSALRTTFGVILFLAIIPLILEQFIPENPPMPFGPINFFGDYIGNVPDWAYAQEFEAISFLPKSILAPVYMVILYILVGLTWLSRYFSPVPAMMEILQNENVLRSDTLVVRDAVWQYAVFALLSAMFFFWLTTRRLRFGMLDRARDAGKVTEERSTKARLLRRLVYMWFFDPNRRAKRIGLSNPVFVKEFRTRKFGRLHWLMRLVMGCLVLSLGLMFAVTKITGGQPGSVMPILALLQVALVLLITPALASGLISSEQESGGWALLQMTPMSATRIVFGKLMSVFVTLLLLLLATTPGYLVVLIISAPAAGPDDADGGIFAIVSNFISSLTTSPLAAKVWQLQVSLMLMGLFAVLLGAMCSSLFKKTTAATATSYTVLAVMCVGTMLFRFAEEAPFSHQAVELILTINPLAAALTLIETPMFSNYPLVTSANPWIMIGGAAACFLVLLYRTRELTKPQ